MKRPHATLKSLPQSLTGCCFISDGENKSNTKGRLEEECPTRGTLWQYTFLAQRVGEEKEAITWAGGCREVTRILPNPDVGQDGGGGRGLKNEHRLAVLGPQLGGRPHTEFFKGGLKWP